MKNGMAYDCSIIKIDHFLKVLFGVCGATWICELLVFFKFGKFSALNS